MDIRCVVCGEPWDAYGVRNGDMAPWQTTLFRAGAGCPSCEGREPEVPFEPESIADIENGDEDPMIRLIQIEERASRPAWVRPEPTTRWECACCGVKVQDDPGADLPEDSVCVVGISVLAYRSELASGRSWPDMDPAHTFDEQTDKKPVCHTCIENCVDCGDPLCQELSDDTYDGKASFYDDDDHYGREPRCISCYETHEAEMRAEQEEEQAQALDEDSDEEVDDLSGDENATDPDTADP